MPDWDELSFEALRDTAMPEVDTLAYWIGSLSAEPWPPAFGATGLHAALSLQYERESQAGESGPLFADLAEWRRTFRPLAPVQLTRGWSPLPLAVEILGPADWQDVEGPSPAGLPRAAAVAWKPPALEDAIAATEAPDPATPDITRFHRLLTAAAVRALVKQRGLLIVACPGWSYDHDGGPFDAEAVGLMERARFLVTDRRPPSEAGHDARSPHDG
jgi:hypothetical protein